MKKSRMIRFIPLKIGAIAMLSEKELEKWKKAIAAGKGDYSNEPPPLYQYLDRYNQSLQEFQAKEITKEQAKEKDVKAYRQYQNWQYLFDGYEALCNEHQENLRKYHDWLIGIDKSETVEKKLEYACKIIADVTGDREIFKRQEVKP